MNNKKKKNKTHSYQKERNTKKQSINKINEIKTKNRKINRTKTWFSENIKRTNLQPKSLRKKRKKKEDQNK